MFKKICNMTVRLMADQGWSETEEPGIEHFLCNPTPTFPCNVPLHVKVAPYEHFAKEEARLRLPLPMTKLSSRMGGMAVPPISMDIPKSKRKATELLPGALLSEEDECKPRQLTAKMRLMVRRPKARLIL